MWEGENILTILSDYRRGLDWLLDLLINYTHRIRNYTLRITDTHRLVSYSITVSTSRFLAADFNTETVTVSLTNTPQMSHTKSSLHCQTFN
jgi:hypothetical protein